MMQVKVDVEIERAAEALNEGDCARARRERSGAAGTPAPLGEDRPQREVERARDEPWVAGEQNARRMPRLVQDESAGRRCAIGLAPF